MTKDDARLAAVVLCALVGFVLAAWASARWGLGDSCWVDAPMEQAQCRVQGQKSRWWQTLKQQGNFNKD